MSAALTRTRIADDVFEFAVQSPKDAQALAQQLRETGYAEDVVAGLDRVAILFHPDQFEQVDAWLSGIEHEPSIEDSAAPLIDIKVQYGGEAGPDFAAICAALELSQDAFISHHTAVEHVVEMIGFTPGFSYISGLPDTFEIPRLSNPRPRVPAGSVGISAAFTGIYALAGPGGWPLIGRTDARLFNPDGDVPFLLRPGHRVRFVAA